MRRRSRPLILPRSPVPARQFPADPACGATGGKRRMSFPWTRGVDQFRRAFRCLLRTRSGAPVTWGVWRPVVSFTPATRRKRCLQQPCRKLWRTSSLRQLQYGTAGCGTLKVRAFRLAEPIILMRMASRSIKLDISTPCSLSISHDPMAGGRPSVATVRPGTSRPTVCRPIPIDMSAPEVARFV